MILEDNMNGCSLWGSLFVEAANREANTGNERLDYVAHRLWTQQLFHEESTSAAIHRKWFRS